MIAFTFEMTWSKFRLLLWKNFILAKRHKISSLFEILFPVFVVSLIVFTKFIKPKPIESKIYEEFRLENCWKNRTIHRVGVAPSRNLALAELIRETDFYQVFEANGIKITFHEDFSELEKYMNNKSVDTAGIEFDGVLGVWIIARWYSTKIILLHFRT